VSDIGAKKDGNRGAKQMQGDTFDRGLVFVSFVFGGQICSVMLDRTDPIDFAFMASDDGRRWKYCG
jgi:hypothetical protein